MQQTFLIIVKFENSFADSYFCEQTFKEFFD